MYISKIELKNIRCFEDFSIELERNGESVLWTTILGDNATGKTTLLRSIAIGLCDESSASGLLKESDEEGYFIRRSRNKATIYIELRNVFDPKVKVSIKTIIDRFRIKKGKYFERLRQSTNPVYDRFPWDNIFVCAYGAGRGISGTGDIAGYSVINAVYNMFNYNEVLQNPELTIRRIKRGSQKEVLRTLKSLMNTNEIKIPPSGIEVNGPWGKRMPLRDLADGYKSTFLWVTDLLGWALSYKPEINSSKDIYGIVLVDEIEQHLHPKWQKVVVYRLKKQFPNVQFITTTHSPLVASSVGQLLEGKNRDKLIHLELKDKNKIVYKELEPLKGLKVDQILASKAFDYLIGADPEVERILAEASELASKGDERTENENNRYHSIKKALKKILQPEGRTLIQRVAEEELYEEMKRRISELEKELFGG